MYLLLFESSEEIRDFIQGENKYFCPLETLTYNVYLLSSLNGKKL